MNELSSTNFNIKRSASDFNKNKNLLPEIFNKSKLMNNNILQVKNGLFDINKFIVKPNNIMKINSKINYKKKEIHIPKIKLKKFKNSKFYLNIDNQANKIVNKLLSKNFNSKEYLNDIKNNCLSERSIYLDPYQLIENKFKFEPENKNLFKSYKLQVKSYGNENLRNNIINSVNDYKFNIIKHKILKKPACYVSNSLNKKNNNKNMKILVKKINSSSSNFNIFTKEKLKTQIDSYNYLMNKNKINNIFDKKIFKSMDLEKKINF